MLLFTLYHPPVIAEYWRFLGTHPAVPLPQRQERSEDWNLELDPNLETQHLNAYNYCFGFFGILQGSPLPYIGSLAGFRIGNGPAVLQDILGTGILYIYGTIKVLGWGKLDHRYGTRAQSLDTANRTPTNLGAKLRVFGIWACQHVVVLRCCWIALPPPAGIAVPSVVSFLYSATCCGKREAINCINFLQISPDASAIHPLISSQPQAWHPNPSLMQQQQQQHPHPMPQGWQGTWPPASNVAFPPGYPGPPPPPAGASAQHPQWQAGWWQYNPNSQGSAPMPWAPGMGWGPKVNYNPYKRIPKPASPSYWETRLSDNGLGLEGMVPRTEREPRPSEDRDGDAVPQTPWIWNPPSLLEANADRATPTRDFKNRRSSQDSTRQGSTPTRDYTGRRSAQAQEAYASDHSTPTHMDRFYAPRSARQGSADSQTMSMTGSASASSRQGSAGSLMGSSSLSRQGSNESYLSRSSVGHGGTSPVHAGVGQPSHVSPSQNLPESRPLGRPSDPNSFYQRIAYSTSQSQLSQSQSQSQSHHTQPTPPSSSASSQFPPPFPAPGPDTRTSRERSPNSSSNPPAFPEPRSQRDRSSPNPPQQPVFTAEPESFTSRVDLQPTFPSGIVRTPDHYRSSRRSSDYDRSPTSMGGNASSSASSFRGPPNGETLSRQSSLPSSSTASISSLTTFSGDVSAALSPLIDATPRPLANSLSRSRTEPSLSRSNNLSTIHESSASYLQRRDQVREYEREREREREREEAFFAPLPPPPDSDESDDDDDTDNESFIPPPPHAVPGPSLRDRRGTPHPTRSSNPLPPPPVERVNLAASAPPPQEPAPAHYSRRVRMGFWNRRGDHLTSNLFVVYAPQDQAYPAELRDYPDETEGYRDQFDTFLPYLADRPELPASLPYHGRPPAQPYEDFVVYSYHQ
ncbi:hypothetical protein BJ138DRAFT_1101929 [Hygrophoropsis aurantiaca]|uniref:Uncharacterized protein n=1 Tax=Hygrophoropsis aurantiaca TaxID=72124 RepID=A0ACB8AB90_9AGAM|nr:hypothetical protein BJ138DRAFT_1101929 [Hygrophoropsis aurantiaca]